jgi:hypothetical protein
VNFFCRQKRRYRCVDVTRTSKGRRGDVTTLSRAGEKMTIPGESKMMTHTDGDGMSALSMQFICGFRVTPPPLPPPLSARPRSRSRERR